MRALGLLLCERFMVDPGTHQVSLVGLFQARSYTRFPSKKDAFTVYSALTGPKPEEGTVPGGLVYHLCVPITIRTYKLPGRYLISLRLWENTGKSLPGRISEGVEE